MEKALQIAAFIIFCASPFLLFMYGLILTTEVDVVLKELAFVPTQTIIIVKAVNIYLKSESIMKMLKSLSDF